MTDERWHTIRVLMKRIAIALSVVTPLLFGVCREMGTTYIDPETALTEALDSAILLVPLIWITYGMACYVWKTFDPHRKLAVNKKPAPQTTAGSVHSVEDHKVLDRAEVEDRKAREARNLKAFTAVLIILTAIALTALLIWVLSM